MRVAVSKYKSQSGIALLMVLLIIVMMVLLTTRLSSQLGLDISRVSDVQAQSNNWQRLLSGEALGVAVLHKDLKKSQRLSLKQDWAKSDINLPVDGGQIKGRIVDMESCFNLNAMHQPTNSNNGSMVETLFLRLLLVEKIPFSQARAIAAATKDWIDSGQHTSQYGAEDNAYRKAGYRTADSYLVSVSQWREVRGVTAKIYKKVSPLLCAIPSERLSIDINTLTSDKAPLLQMLFYGYLDPKGALKIIQRRPQDGFHQVLQILSNPELASARLDKGVIRVMTLTSRYFQIELHASSPQGLQSSLYSLVYRKSVASLEVVRRTLGDWY